MHDIVSALTVVVAATRFTDFYVLPILLTHALTNFMHVHSLMPTPNFTHVFSPYSFESPVGGCELHWARPCLAWVALHIFGMEGLAFLL